MRLRGKFACASVALAALIAPSGTWAAAPLQVDGGRIVDRSGRTVMLHGVNVNGLGDYWQARPEIPSTIPLTREDFDRIAAIGMNSVRLLVSWSRLEPQPGVHNDAYLREIEQAVGWARDAGLMVVIDMHQDAWGKGVHTRPREICPPLLAPAVGWDGAPDWATLTDGLPNCKLVVRELSPSTTRAWQSFWNNRVPPNTGGIGIRDRFVATWGWLASAFANDPTVIGYDVLNEPNWGEDYVRNIYGGRAAMYRGVLAAIRAGEPAGQNKLVFFEPFGLWSAWPSEVTYRWTADPNVVYAPHIYVGSISLDKVLLGAEAIPLRGGFESARSEAAYLGRVPVWVGEWGWFGGVSDYWKRFAALEDEFQFGSAMWQWRQACGDPHNFASPTADPPSSSQGLVLLRCGDGDHPGGVETGLNQEAAAALGRPYPRAYPGRAVFRSDVDKRSLVVTGEAASTERPLEVWIPGESMPSVKVEGMRVRVRIKRPGGWIVRARPLGGAYRLTAIGAGTVAR